MTVAKVSYTVNIVCGSLTAHLWCDRCQTSGRYTADVLVLGKDGVSPVGTLDRCVRCDHEPDEQETP